MNRVYNGMIIFANYDIDFELAADHDQVWVYGNLDELLKNPQDVRSLADLGWHEQEGTWYHYV